MVDSLSMTLTTNEYNYPFDFKDYRERIHESTMHVGKLSHSIDFKLKQNAFIFAALDGRILKIETGNDLSLTGICGCRACYLEIGHINNEVSTYSNILLKTADMKIGSRIRNGQFIGKVNNSEHSGGCEGYLHFDVRRYLGADEFNFLTREIRWK